MCIFSIVCVGELQFPTTGKQILGQRYWRKLKLQIGSDKIHFLSCFLLLFFILMFTHLKKPSVILTFSLPVLCFTYTQVFYFQCDVNLFSRAFGTGHVLQVFLRLQHSFHANCTFKSPVSPSTPPSTTLLSRTWKLVDVSGQERIN